MVNSSYTNPSDPSSMRNLGGPLKHDPLSEKQSYEHYIPNNFSESSSQNTEGRKTKTPNTTKTRSQREDFYNNLNLGYTFGGKSNIKNAHFNQRSESTEPHRTDLRGQNFLQSQQIQQDVSQLNPQIKHHNLSHDQIKQDESQIYQQMDQNNNPKGNETLEDKIKVSITHSRPQSRQEVSIQNQQTSQSKQKQGSFLSKQNSQSRLQQQMEQIQKKYSSTQQFNQQSQKSIFQKPAQQIQELQSTINRRPKTASSRSSCQKVPANKSFKIQKELNQIKSQKLLSKTFDMQQEKQLDQQVSKIQASNKGKNGQRDQNTQSYIPSMTVDQMINIKNNNSKKTFSKKIASNKSEDLDNKDIKQQQRQEDNNQTGDQQALEQNDQSNLEQDEEMKSVASKKTIRTINNEDSQSIRSISTGRSTYVSQTAIDNIYKMLQEERKVIFYNLQRREQLEGLLLNYIEKNPDLVKSQ